MSDWLPLLIVPLALLLDHWLGEPARYHPLVGFGQIATRLEALCNRGVWRRGRGLLSWLLLVLLPAWLCGWVDRQLLQYHTAAYGVWAILVLTLTVGRRSLGEHVQEVEWALRRSLPQGQAAVSRIVSRDCQAMDALAIRRAALESQLENTLDAVIAPLFWFALAGPAGALCYRLANTLDAMWGYRTPRFEAFGWAAARLDDLLNYLPARLLAGAFWLLSGLRRGWWRQLRAQLPACASPNGGPVMVGGALTLGITLGGPACYHGQWRDKPLMGDGREPAAADIPRALRLCDGALLLLLPLLIGLALSVGGY